MGKVKRFVDQTARVYCGMRGTDVDIETCLGCVSLKTYDLDARQPYVVCERPDDPSRELRWPSGRVLESSR